VRARVQVLAADVLPALAELPASLRKVATFAPQRRARLGGSQIAAVLETDDDFRRRVADQVSAVLPDLADALAAGAVPAAADPVDVAALAWLTRDGGWEATFDDAVRRVEEAAAPRDVAELERARARVEVVERGLRELRAEHKAQLDEAKAENTLLRRRLGEERAARRSADEATSAELAEVRVSRERAEAALAASEAEVRRLRAEVEELRAAATSARRDIRTDRDEANVRTRLLLDALIEAGQGLRRELGLPPTVGTPAERLAAELLEARAVGNAPAVGPADAVLLERYLALPRARLIIDGYNVSKTAWPSSTLEAQRARLMGALAPLVSRVGAETTVVFDAASSTTRPPVVAPRGVKVVFSPQGVIADDVIRDLVDVEPTGRTVVVVTSDAELGRDVVKAGARPVASAALVALLARDG
jgi:predicted RNA-binding protein with PIN domain